MRTIMLSSTVALAALGLGGCSPQANDAAQPADGNVAATVAGLAPGQQRGVLFRAIRDAGLACQHVAGAEQMPDSHGHAQWRARCDDGIEHLVDVAPDGVATVVSPKGS